jgi:hypothetical protein
MTGRESSALFSLSVDDADPMRPDFGAECACCGRWMARGPSAAAVLLQAVDHVCPAVEAIAGGAHRPEPVGAPA